MLRPHRFSIAVLVALLPACGDDEKAPAPPLSNPRVLIDALLPAGGPVVEGDLLRGGAARVELGRDPGRTVVVRLAPVTGWTFEAPYGCGGERCGYVLLSIEPESEPAGLRLDVPAASRFISAPMGVFATAVPRRLRFSVELREALGDPAKAVDGGFYRDEIVVEVVAGPGDGGLPDGATDGAVPDGEGGVPDGALLDGPGFEASLPDGPLGDGPPTDAPVADAPVPDSTTPPSDAAPPDAALDGGASVPESGTPSSDAAADTGAGGG